MKLLIIEGTDNVGKDTIINQLKNDFNYYKIYHCEKPSDYENLTKHQKNLLQADEQKNNFIKLMSHTIYDYISCDIMDNKNPIIIHNRSWYGEYVYGCLYRNNSEYEVKQMIKNLELSILKVIPQEDIYFITLLSDNMNFLSKNEDGKSLSEGDIYKMEIETNRFKEIHNLSLFKNKCIIYVNDGESFKDKNEIYNKIINFIS